MTGKWHERNFPLVSLVAASHSRAHVCSSRPSETCLTTCSGSQRSKLPRCHHTRGFHQFGRGGAPAIKHRPARADDRLTLLLSLLEQQRALAAGDRCLPSRFHKNRSSLASRHMSLAPSWLPSLLLWLIEPLSLLFISSGPPGFLASRATLSTVRL